MTSATLDAGSPDCPFGGSSFTSASGATFACNGAPGPQGPPGTFDPTQVIANGTAPQTASFNVTGSGAVGGAFQAQSISVGTGPTAQLLRVQSFAGTEAALITAYTPSNFTPILEVSHGSFTGGVGIGSGAIFAVPQNANKDLLISAAGFGSLLLNTASGAGVAIGSGSISALPQNANKDLSVSAAGTGSLLLNAGAGAAVGIGTTAPAAGTRLNATGISLFGTTTLPAQGGEPIQVGGSQSGITYADRTAGNPRWVTYANAGAFRVWNGNAGDLVDVSNSGVDVNTVSAFNPNAVAANHVELGHIQATNGWDAVGFCAAASGTMCTATTQGLFLWGNLTAANQMDTRMSLNGTSGLLVTTGGFAQASSQRFKKDIHFLDDGELDRALQTVTATPIATYRYRSASEASKVNYGVIAEKTPSELLTDSNDAVNLSNSIGVLMAAVKAQQKEIDALKVELRAHHCAK